jgi:hypothetical protein
MIALMTGDKVRMKHRGTQFTDYTVATKTGRIISISRDQGNVVARVTWNIGLAVTEEYAEDLELMKDEHHGN